VNCPGLAKTFPNGLENKAIAQQIRTLFLKHSTYTASVLPALRAALPFWSPGLSSYPVNGAWLEVFDDASNNCAHLAWGWVRRRSYNTNVGDTFPRGANLW